jgi:hypothetical protein
LSERKDSKGRVYWDCICSCGKARTVITWSLTSGKTKSCGCFQKDVVKSADHRKNIAGQRFGKLIATEYSRTINSKVYWICRCDCGKTKEVMGSSLLSGRTKSCGCMTRLPAGESMFNSAYHAYKKGAEKRGLSFTLSTEEFRELTSQDCFYCGDKPSNALTSAIGEKYIYNGIDRVDNTKGYFVENCVPCCEMCNKAKATHTQEKFFYWTIRLYNKFVLKSSLGKVKERA